MAIALSDLVSVNPATLEEVGRVPIAQPEAVLEAVGEAGAAQAAWRRAPSAERRRVLAALAEALLDEADEIAATMTAETGRPLVEAYTVDVFTAVENVAWLARSFASILADERVRVPFWLRHKRLRVVHEPLGVIGVISPWNVPLAIPLTQAAAAVAAGNGVVVKPSERAPLTGAWVERLFVRAGAPAGLVRVVQGGPETGEVLVRAGAVTKVLFTGSASAARAVAVAAGERLRPVTLELGGKDPMVVFADADLQRAAAGAVWGAFANCGQLCAGVERIYVELPAYERFLDALVTRTRELRIGDGADLDTEVGPLIAEEERARVEGLLAEALDHGAQVATGGGRPTVGLPGWFLEPTVVVDGPLPDDEVFGPLVSVEPFRDEGEAVRRANESRFGLGASVWTRDRRRAAHVGARLAAGMVWMNDHAYSYGIGGAPWGGRKGSGFGRSHSRHGLYDVVEPKLVDADAGRVGVLWWYPYGAAEAGAFRGMLDVLYRPTVAAKAAAAWRHRRGLLGLGARYVSPP